MFKEELTLVSAKLEQVNGEKRDLALHVQKLQKDHKFWEEETEKARAESDRVGKDRDNLRTESVRLKHRISYLEEQVRN
jgi:predicted nuclease with TOPRIM domain